MTAPAATGSATTSHGVNSPRRAAIAEKTLRTDKWWFNPLLVFLGLASFVVYGVWRAFMNKHYWADTEHYLAPFYSPCMTASCVEGSSHFLGQPFGFMPDWISPALLILVLPGGFRLTCYYYRKAYYRSFWLSPPACAVPDGHKKYSGETKFPLIFQNIHRYFFYAAILVAGVLTYDAFLALQGIDGGLGIGVGTVLLWINVVLIWGYTLGCHSCRSIIGGRLTHFSKHPVRYRLWGWVSQLNARHQFLAWASLFSVMIADFYVASVAAGWIDDIRFFN